MDIPARRAGDAIVSVKPIHVAAPGRPEALQVRVSAPVEGTDLPVILFAHGFGSDHDAYAPLVDHWAQHGFVVIQPTFLDSRRSAFTPDGPQWPQVWRTRVDDMVHVLDRLEVIESAVPGLSGRVDRGRVVAAGHSFGGQTAGVLIGLRVTDPLTGGVEDLSDSRVMAGVVLATAGAGGDELTPRAREFAPWLQDQDFSRVTAPELVVAGDRDHLGMSGREPLWSADPYHLSGPGKSLLTVFGGEHLLGGISGYGVAETTDESPERVALVQQVTLAYLRHVTGIDHDAWEALQSSMAGGGHRLGRLETK